MADNVRRFVQVTVSKKESEAVEYVEVGHFTDGPHDGTARLEVRTRKGKSLIIALGPVAASKLGAGLLAASFDHNAAIERWDARV
jgi:hypothetical protein